MDILIPVTFIVAFLSSIISGMSGGGGGFIMTPCHNKSLQGLCTTNKVTQ
jgi:uncharacterized membrane protein YfcA